MRQASNNIEIVQNDEQILLSFGFDFCAEHEWGIKKLQYVFGIDPKSEDVTLQKFTPTQHPDTIFLFEQTVNKKRYICLLGGRILLSENQSPKNYVTGWRLYHRDDKPTSAWSESEFYFAVPYTEEHEIQLRKIYDALLADDVIIFQAGSRNPFGGSGLCIARKSTLEKDSVEMMESTLREQKRLHDAGMATGIRQRLTEWHQAKNTGYGREPFFALSPSFIGERFKDKKTKYDVVYWLNPMEQDKNNFGWYTVEELEQWMDGRGPIPKKPEKVKQIHE